VQLQDLGSGSFGCCKLAIDKSDGEKVAVKFIPRGPKARAAGLKMQQLLRIIIASTLPSHALLPAAKGCLTETGCS
jgi:hypothetical protein